jgi:hypothetical protein
VPCPRCEAPIAVPRQDAGWERTEISTLFEHPNTSRRPEDRPPAQPDAKEPARVFRDVTSVARPTLSIHPDEPDESTDPAPSPTDDDSGSLLERLKRIEPGRLRAPGEGEKREEKEVKNGKQPMEEHEEALEQALEEDLLTIADQAADAVVDAPDLEPKPQAAHPEPQAGHPKPQAAHPEPQAAHLTPADRDGPWPIRVDDVVYDPVDEDGLATLLKSGVWLEVIELEASRGGWIPLEAHPVYPEVRRRLLRQTQRIVEKVTTGEWERDATPEPAAPKPAVPKPAVPEPAVPKPAVPKPAADEPAAPKPAVDEPAVPEPAVPEPAVPKPAVPKPRRPRWIGRLTRAMWILANIAVGAALGVYLFAPNGPDEPDGAPGAAGDAPVLETPLHSAPTPAHWQEAIDSARGHVAEASRADTFARALLAEERFELARELLIEAMVATSVRPHLKEAFNEALAADPALRQEVVTLGVDEKIDSIRALGGGHSVTLRMTQRGQNAFAYKPAQQAWGFDGHGWRVEVAAYLLCELISCPFEVPLNRPARISREHFEELYGRIDGDWQATYTERFEELVWEEEAGPDGVRREYLYGTLKDWVPRFVDWPIEYTDVWEDWLDVRFHPANLDEPFADALAPLEEHADGAFYDKILAEDSQPQLRDVARQISALLVFDYVTHNFDRFSSKPEYYGVNNQYADGTFISLDNGAAFPLKALEDMDPRIELTTRFSHRMLTALRALSADAVDEILFPDASSVERRRLELFWQQRDKLMQRVDALIAHYGEERVFEFR